MHAATPRLTTTSNATIFWKHEVFVDCCHMLSLVMSFFLYIFCKNEGKNISFNPGLISKFFSFQTFVIRMLYVYNVILKHVLKYIKTNFLFT